MPDATDWSDTVDADLPPTGPVLCVGVSAIADELRTAAKVLSVRTADDGLAVLAGTAPRAAVVSNVVASISCTRRQLLDELDTAGVPVVILDVRHDRYRLTPSREGERHVTLGHPVSAWAVAETARWLGADVGPVPKGPLLTADDPHLDNGVVAGFKRGRIYELDDGRYGFAGAYARVPVPREATARCSHPAHPRDVAPDYSTDCWHGFSAFDRPDGAWAYRPHVYGFRHCPVFAVKLSGTVLHAGSGWGPYDFRVGERQTILSVTYPTVCVMRDCEGEAVAFGRAQPRDRGREIVPACEAHLGSRPVDIEQLGERLGLPTRWATTEPC